MTAGTHAKMKYKATSSLMPPNTTLRRLIAQNTEQKKKKKKKKITMRAATRPATNDYRIFAATKER